MDRLVTGSNQTRQTLIRQAATACRQFDAKAMHLTPACGCMHQSIELTGELTGTACYFDK